MEPANQAEVVCSIMRNPEPGGNFWIRIKSAIAAGHWRIRWKPQQRFSLAPVNGGWDTTMLTPSGKFVRNNLINDPFIETSGISNINMKGICLIYPNPARDNLNIILTGNPDNNNKMEIFNITGKLIVTRKIQNSTSTSDIGDFIQGIYQLKLVNGNQVFRGSFIKE